MTKKEKSKLQMAINVWRENLKAYILKGDQEKIDQIREKIAKLEYQLKTGEEYNENSED